MKKLLCLISAGISLNSFAVTDDGLSSLRLVKADGSNGVVGGAHKKVEEFPLFLWGYSYSSDYSIENPISSVKYEPIGGKWISGKNYHASQTYDGTRPFFAFGEENNHIIFNAVSHHNSNLVRKFFERHYGSPYNFLTAKWVNNTVPDDANFGSVGTLTIKFKNDPQPYVIKDVGFFQHPGEQATFGFTGPVDNCTPFRKNKRDGVRCKDAFSDRYLTFIGAHYSIHYRNILGVYTGT